MAPESILRPLVRCVGVDVLHSCKPLRPKDFGPVEPKADSRRFVPSVSKHHHLLAIDLGLRGGMALFGQDGRLRWYRSQHFGTVSQLRRAATHIIGETRDLQWILSEGDYSLAAVWERVAMKQRVRVQRVSAEAWRGDLLYSRERHSAAEAKKSAVTLARCIIDWSGIPQPASLRHDAAEAILIGLWGVMQVGWLDILPEPLRARQMAKKVAGL